MPVAQRDTTNGEGLLNGESRHLKFESSASLPRLQSSDHSVEEDLGLRDYDECREGRRELDHERCKRILGSDTERVIELLVVCGDRVAPKS